MSAAQFNVQNYTDSRLELSAVWAIVLLISFTEIARVVYSKIVSLNVCPIVSKWQLQLVFKMN